LLSLISILWGIGLLTVLNVFPGGMVSHLKTTICTANDVTSDAQMDLVYCKMSQSGIMLNDAATNAIMLGMMSVVLLLVIIRLNGNNRIRIVISWLMGTGVVLYAAAAFYNAMNFVNSTNLNMESADHWLLIPGIVLLFCGVLLAVIKIIKDITEPVGVS